jgi:hypothetical protein
MLPTARRARAAAKGGGFHTRWLPTLVAGLRNGPVGARSSVMRDSSEAVAKQRSARPCRREPWV